MRLSYPIRPHLSSRTGKVLFSSRFAKSSWRTAQADHAACLVQDGEILSAAQEERFTRKKHDFSFPTNAINFCLENSSLRASDLDYAAFYDKPFLKFERILETYLAFAPLGIRSFIEAVPLWIKQKLWMSPAVIMGWFVTRLILVTLFYFVPTPTALLLRILGKDILDISFNRNSGPPRRLWRTAARRTYRVHSGSRDVAIYICPFLKCPK